jgi:hypothetical protein
LKRWVAGAHPVICFDQAVSHARRIFMNAYLSDIAALRSGGS